MPMGLALKQRVPTTAVVANPYVFIQDMYYDPVSNLIWVADLENTHPVIPVINASTGTTHTVVDTSPMGWGTGGAGYGYQGAKQLTADANYVYASNYNHADTIAVISKSTFQIVGKFSTNYGSPTAVEHGGPICAGNGFLYMAGGGKNLATGVDVNILEWNPATAVAAYPTPVAYSRANIQNYAWPFSLNPANAMWNAVTIGYDPSTDHLWFGTDNGVAGSAPGSVVNEALFDVNRSTLTLSTANLFTKNGPTVSSYAYTIFTDTTYSGGTFNQIISCLSERNPFDPGNYTFGTTTAQVYQTISPFVTLPTTPNPPYSVNAATYRTTHDDVNDTLFVMFVVPQNGSGMEVARYNSSGTLVSTFGDPGSVSYVGQNEVTQTVATTSNKIYMSRFYEISTPSFKLISSILVFTGTPGSETQINELFGY